MKTPVFALIRNDLPDNIDLDYVAIKGIYHSAEDAEEAYQNCKQNESDGKCRYAIIQTRLYPERTPQVEFEAYRAEQRKGTDPLNLMRVFHIPSAVLYEIGRKLIDLSNVLKP